MSPIPQMRVVNVSSPPTTRLLRACAAFGLALRHAPNPTPTDTRRPRRPADARRILRSLAPGRIALITGPSGGGKSSLLQDISAQAAQTPEHILPLPHPPREAPIIDLIPGPLAEAIATLARAGLGDATLLPRTPAELSEGERFRFRLALTMAQIHRATDFAAHGSRTHLKEQTPRRSRCEMPATPTPPTTILIDEFASTLDRTTARCLCHALRRWLARTNEQGSRVRLIIATAHHDVARWLEPDLVAVVPLGKAAIEFNRATGIAAHEPLPMTLRASGRASRCALASHPQIGVAA
jgi:hypothetical protein